MEYMTHHDHVRIRKLVAKKITGCKFEATGKIILCYIIVEDRRHDLQVEANSLQVWMSQRDLHRQIALRCSDIGESFVVGPREFLGDRHVRRLTKASHRNEELSQAVSVRIQRSKQGFSTAFCLVLR